MSITLVCDGCGEEDSIVGDDVIQATARIGGWNIEDDGSLSPDPESLASLARLNDSGMKFADIADLIEKSL